MAAQHPKGLPFLFLTELWERFGYYLMIGIFVLYLKDTEAGKGMSTAEASDLYGTFIALVYLTPFIGGLLADRLLGYRRAIVAGGVLMGLGYMALALPGWPAFYGALFLIILGNGFFKPNISTLLGNLYNADAFRANKDTGFNIFYMGINVGAFICNFFAAYLRNAYDWGAAFIGAGVGMFIGVAVFMLGNRHYAHADVPKAPSPNDVPLGQLGLRVLLPVVLAGVLGWFLNGAITGSRSNDAFLLACVPVLVFFGSVYVQAEASEKKPIAALLAIYAVVIIFWAVFKQNGSALTVWAESYTHREVPAALAAPAQALHLAEEIPDTTGQYPATDAQFRTQKGPDGKPLKTERQHPYLQNLPADQHPAPGGSLLVFSTELFQSINPFFVVVLTPAVVAFWGLLRRRKREPTTPAKIAWGLVVSAVSCLCMVGAVAACGNGDVKASAWWLFADYGVITIGELFLSPMGLSLVSKLSPARIAGLMMGGWSLATSIGNKLSGTLATLWDTYDDKGNYFLLNVALLAAAAAAIFMMLRWLNGIFRAYVPEG